MGRELKATGVVIEGRGTVAVEDLMTPGAAALLAGCTKALIDKQVFFTARLDSVKLGSARLVLRSQVEAFKAELEMERAAELLKSGAPLCEVRAAIGAIGADSAPETPAAQKAAA